MYLVLTAILALNVSAEVIEAFKTVDKSLGNSNTNLGNSTNTTFKSLNDKQAEAKTAEQAKIWYPKADQAVQLTKGLDTYINGLKDQLKTAAGATATNPSFKEDNLDASTRLFETNGLGKQLEQKLKDYKTAMLAIDPKISAEFANNFPVNTDGVGSKDFTTSYFHMTPTVAALTMLSKFQNNIKNAENQVVSFAHSQVGAVEYVYDQFKTIIGTSSTYLMPGEEMEVTAGIGSFSKSAAPTVTINGVSQSANADGVAIRKFPVSGSGTVHVVVTYTKPDGTKGTDTKDIPYTVGVPGGAAVMLDKMNVFYIGVDNPITIGSPKGWDKTSVSGNGCSLSGSGGKRVVTVTTPGTASITVSAEGSTPTTFPFRVKTVPNPVFKVGDGKARMASVAFKGQQFCRAELENFDFDTRFSVVSATVYFSGAGFPNVATAPLNGKVRTWRIYQRCGSLCVQ
ncbi:MAG: gliding motility protein GldM [Chitinophagaceae bacterium]|nr:gliding motility protein GldM [Chitinophagaceae bacterium]